ncbi:hypothetical protein H4Q26_006006 [Puccinia striiformis f. sp. tritici PST-130]|nr:hypothetical protein H4Q26_006006 [Puccinia striiformis f. sp. tritici PST-130]
MSVIIITPHIHTQYDTYPSCYSHCRPEPPKITTSLADRIARLNATQAQSSDRNHGQLHEQVGEIKSKISKYEATGQHEAPLMPKGSFGLGAPTTRADRGLDRMRIASLGVSGGTTVAPSPATIKPPNSLSASAGTSRSVSLGRQNNRSLSSDRNSPSQSPSQPQTDSIPTPPQEDTPDSPTEEEAKTKHNDQSEDPHQDANRSFDSADAYDGILDGYPTTPAEEDCPPMVTCSNCSESVELELLGEHVCDLSNGPRSARSTSGRFTDGSRLCPVDVPVDAVESPSLVISQEHASISNNAHDHPLPSPTSSVCSSSKLTHDPISITTNAHLSPSDPLRPSTPVIKEMVTTEEKDGSSSKLSSSPQTSPTSSLKNKLHETPSINNHRNSDSSHSTNTTRLSTNGPILPNSASSSARKSWYDDDDDPDYYDSGNAPTGFVTIVRSSNRS